VKKGRKGKRPGQAVNDDLLRQDFTTTQPYLRWVTDLTEQPTAEGAIYRCAELHLFSNRTVGYAVTDRVTADLAVRALRTALARCDPGGVVFVRADRRSQFRARSF